MSTLKWMSIGLLLSLPSLAVAQARYNPFAGNPLPAAGTSSPARSTGTAGTTIVTNMRLKAVLPMGNPAMANIDGEIVAVGEKVNGYVLRSVGEQGVTLESRGRRFQLNFKSAEEIAREEKDAAANLTAGAVPGAPS
jgi:hypothetical protein